MMKEYSKLIFGLILIFLFTVTGYLIDYLVQPETPKMVNCYDDRGNIINDVTCTEVHHSTFAIIMMVVGLFLSCYWAMM